MFGLLLQIKEDIWTLYDEREFSSKEEVEEFICAMYDSGLNGWHMSDFKIVQFVDS